MAARCWHRRRCLRRSRRAIPRRAKLAGLAGRRPQRLLAGGPAGAVRRASRQRLRHAAVEEGRWPPGKPVGRIVRNRRWRAPGAGGPVPTATSAVVAYAEVPFARITRAMPNVPLPPARPALRQGGPTWNAATSNSTAARRKPCRHPDADSDLRIAAAPCRIRSPSELGGDPGAGGASCCCCWCGAAAGSWCGRARWRWQGGAVDAAPPGRLAGGAAGSRCCADARARKANTAPGGRAGGDRPRHLPGL